MIANERRAPKAIGLLLVMLAAGAGGPARANTFDDDHDDARPVRAETWQATAGLRATLIRDRGFDPFATKDSLPQASLDLSRVLIRRGPLALAAGLALDIGTSDAPARSAAAHLRAIRVSVPVELRVAPHARGYLFARVAPGWLRVDASLADDSSPATMAGDFDALSIDASAGLAVRVTPDRSVVGFWIRADGGYSYAASHALVLQPALGDADRSKAGSLALAPLAARGMFGRLAVAITY